MPNETSFCCIFQQITAPRTIRNQEKKKNLSPRVLSVRTRNWAQQCKAQQEIMTFIQSTSFGRKNSNKAFSSSNIDSVVGCSLKLFRSFSKRFLCHTSKGKHEIRDLRITTRDYIVYYEHRYCNRFLISCGEVFRCSQSSSLLQL